MLGLDSVCCGRGGSCDGQLVCNFLDVCFGPCASLIKIDMDCMENAELIRKAGVPEDEALLVLAGIYVRRGDGIHFTDSFVRVCFYPCDGSKYEQL